MKESLYISIIIPVYNTESKLARCLDSLLLQKYKQFEVLLIDDGSTDRSGNICKQYAKKDPRFHVFHQCNMGVSAARNKGLSLVTGDYVAFLDADDWVSESYLSDLVSELKPDTDILFFGGKYVTDTSTEIATFISLDTSSFKSINALIEYTINSNIFGHVWLMWIRRTVLEKNNIHFNTNISLHEDFIFTCECIISTTRLTMSTAQPYRYVIPNNNKERNLSLNIPANYQYIAKECLSKFKQMGDLLPHPKEFINEIYTRMQQQFYIGCIDVIIREKSLTLFERRKRIKELNALYSMIFPIKLYDKRSPIKQQIFQFIVNSKNSFLIYLSKRIILSLKNK